jgi:beta-lactamase class A
MCSTFKWILAAAILSAVDQGKLTLSQQIAFSESDLLDHAPTTRAKLAEGRLSVEELARATVINSDNTAANLLLPLIGGPAGLTAFVRANGDAVTRFDRNEPTLNTNLPDDPRDTTTPRAMAALMRTILMRGAKAGPLARDSRDRLLGWLTDCETGHERLRAGLPADWLAADKTGTGARSAVNDIAVLEPPRRSPIMVAAFLSDSGKTPRELNPAHAAIAREISAWVAAR